MISCCWVIMNISEVPWHHHNVVLYSCEVVNHQFSLILRHSARSWFTQVYRYFSSSTSAAAPRLVMKRWSQQPVMVAQCLQQHSSRTHLLNQPSTPRLENSFHPDQTTKWSHQPGFTVPRCSHTSTNQRRGLWTLPPIRSGSVWRHEMTAQVMRNRTRPHAWLVQAADSCF